ncbi:hypothetical protein BOTBODRAFT_169074 [Botryobasidium botryosum FD-172 SS1]|uniref:Uncharacterized protein n=1 Tax=Botryobasidium botryosum (strain FD-172 SS1) TaxID=930990 RepID=A0A067NCR6_BOTB1|nr:hypothetical protein BOTBODRAFT_169074 [Botryobasidium botryosum FD-172 SS1]
MQPRIFKTVLKKIKAALPSRAIQHLVGRQLGGLAAHQVLDRSRGQSGLDFLENSLENSGLHDDDSDSCCTRIIHVLNVNVHPPAIYAPQVAAAPFSALRLLRIGGANDDNSPAVPELSCVWESHDSTVPLAIAAHSLISECFLLPVHGSGALDLHVPPSLPPLPPTLPAPPSASASTVAPCTAAMVGAIPLISRRLHIAERATAFRHAMPGLYRRVQHAQAATTAAATIVTSAPGPSVPPTSSASSSSITAPPLPTTSLASTSGTAVPRAAAVRGPNSLDHRRIHAVATAVPNSPAPAPPVPVPLVPPPASAPPGSAMEPGVRPPTEFAGGPVDIVLSILGQEYVRVRLWGVSREVKAEMIGVELRWSGEEEGSLAS